MAENIDESLTVQKERIISKLKNNIELSLLESLKIFEPDVTITQTESFSNKIDTFYTVNLFDKIANEEIPYRVLESKVLLSNKSYVIQLKNSLLDKKDLIESIVSIVVMLLLLIILGLVVLNRLVSRKLWRPFYKAIEQLDRFKIEDNSALHFEKNNIAEFTTLNKSITALTKRNQEVYQAQKEYSENASHEMQTPLAIFQAKLDLLMQTKPLNKEQYELISDLENVNQRLSRLNKSLLLLTKIENNQFPETENISTKQLLEKLVEQYRFQADQKNITILIDFDNDIVVHSNKSLIEIMLGNLLSNAIRHNINNGLVVLEGSQKTISFTNTSNGPRLNTDSIFQRFQKHTMDSNSIGLGLQISKKIADRYHFRINYNFTNEQHIFNLTVN